METGGRPQTPSDLKDPFSIRLADPADPTKTIEIQLSDTGTLTPDGKRLMRLGVDPSFSTKPVLLDAGLSIAPGGTVTFPVGPIKLLHNFGMAISIESNLHALGTLGLIAWLESSPDGTNWDTEKLITGLEPAPVFGARAQKTTLCDSSPKYIRIKITAQDPVYGAPSTWVRIVH